MCVEVPERVAHTEVARAAAALLLLPSLHTGLFGDVLRLQWRAEPCLAARSS